MPYAFRSCAAAWLKTGPTPFCGEDMRWSVVNGVRTCGGVRCAWGEDMRWRVVCMECGAWGAVHGVWCTGCGARGGCMEWVLRVWRLRQGCSLGPIGLG
eukprot:scaffold28493_cov66-Phaeocystis_antarctica.AAC.5